LEGYLYITDFSSFKL